MARPDKIMFLLGSGVSRGLPCMDQLTDSILNKPWCAGSAGFPLRIDDPEYPGNKGDSACVCRTFLNVLQEYMQRSGWKRFDYEEIFRVCHMLNRESDRPIMQPHMNKIDEDPRMNSVKQKYPGGHWGNDALAQDAMWYIAKVVRQELLDGEPVGLDLLKEVCEHVPHVDICTLNHDIQIEKYLEREPKVKYFDGFKQEAVVNNDVFPYAPLLYSELDRNWTTAEKVVRLIKVHGSIDWFYTNDGTRAGMSKCRHPERLNPQKMNHWSTPSIICGTGNKAQEYTKDAAFQDMWCWFHRLLIEHDSIVASGYGFHDEAVNRQLANWLAYKPASRIIMLYKEHDQAWKIVKRAFDSWMEQGRFIWEHISSNPVNCLTTNPGKGGKYLQHTTWADLDKLLDECDRSRAQASEAELPEKGDDKDA